MALSRQVLSDITFRSLNINSPRAEKGYIVPKAAKPRDLCCRVLDFVDDILDNLHREEGHTLIHQNHLAICQVEVTDKMRAILVDWLVDVHLKYKCRPETMYLAVNILDRYLMCQPVEKKKLQLVGCVAMMLAAKYEEVMPPEVRDFVHISANTYTKSEMIMTEKRILVELDYMLTVPTLWQFLVPLVDVEVEELHKHAAGYLAEQTLMTGTLCGYAPSVQAAACVYLARSVLGASETWTEKHKMTVHEIDMDEVLEAVAVLKDYILKVPNLRVCAVRKKYNQARYLFVSATFDCYARSATA
eukprot:TRINITY_DN17735_c0_g1_i7.p1 TRINITY_DN17735_c0_g1~~TRINITY_DN17735_c0_g1_i7.p1  ORF type:complete len:302 (+),score=119.27 TRINITY_DN17735_c0_g1_i7:52-957(+)